MISDLGASILLVGDLWALLYKLAIYGAQILLISYFKGTPLRPSIMYG